MGIRMKEAKIGPCVRSHLENICNINNMVERWCLPGKHLFWKDQGIKVDSYWAVGWEGCNRKIANFNSQQSKFLIKHKFLVLEELTKYYDDWILEMLSSRWEDTCFQKSIRAKKSCSQCCARGSEQINAVKFPGLQTKFWQQCFVGFFKNKVFKLRTATALKGRTDSWLILGLEA